ncbi:MAG TPA: V-type ATP synthase subunit D [bacterium]|nr:V-type ATP synthase subunit D [bacterium]HPS30489.1 V-type ATP synthase subunit D [bacterium]
MSVIKLNKTELKTQKNLLAQLVKYLPTLQLKKQQLQAEVENSRNMETAILTAIDKRRNYMKTWAVVLSQKLTINVYQMVEIDQIFTETENVAGVDVKVFKDLSFKPFEYSFFIKPVWVDRAYEELRALVVDRERLRIIRERLDLLSEELRQTSIKVNLFEKRMIPQCRENIKKIKIFLGDQEIAAICNAKIAKDKLKRKELIQHAEAV